MAPIFPLMSHFSLILSWHEELPPATAALSEQHQSTQASDGKAQLPLLQNRWLMVDQYPCPISCSVENKATILVCSSPCFRVSRVTNSTDTCDMEPSQETLTHSQREPSPFRYYSNLVINVRLLQNYPLKSLNTLLTEWQKHSTIHPVVIQTCNKSLQQAHLK